LLSFKKIVVFLLIFKKIHPPFFYRQRGREDDLLGFSFLRMNEKYKPYYTCMRGIWEGVKQREVNGNWNYYPSIPDLLKKAGSYEEILQVFSSTLFAHFLEAERGEFERIGRIIFSEPPSPAPAQLCLWNEWQEGLSFEAAQAYLGSGDEDSLRPHVFSSLVLDAITRVSRSVPDDFLRLLALHRFLLESLMILNKNFERALSSFFSEVFSWTKDDADDTFYETDDDPSFYSEKKLQEKVIFFVLKKEDRTVEYGCKIDDKEVVFFSFFSISGSFLMSDSEEFEMFLVTHLFSQKIELLTALYDEDLLSAFPRLRTLLAFGRLPDADKDIS